MSRVKIWVSSDPHLGHDKILTFKRGDGSPLRDFKDISEHDEMIVRYHNELVLPTDHWYCLGDVAIKKHNLATIRRLNGHKRLVRGNHDIFRTRDYIDVGFEEIYGCRVWPEHKTIFTHIPIHPASLKRGWVNVHGHTHSNFVTKIKDWNDDNFSGTSGESHVQREVDRDERYRCVSMEQIDYKPVLCFEGTEKKL